MECKECKIVCDETEIATINCKDGGFTVKCADKGKNICKKLFKGCC